MSLGGSLLLKYFKYTILLNTFLLVGCVFDTTSKFSIDKLPNATIGRPYSEVIGIRGGNMPNEDNLRWIITPQNSGLNIKPSTAREGWSREIEIYGTPNIKGHISVYLWGGGYGAFPTTPSSYFNKTFIIKVDQSLNK